MFLSSDPDEMLTPDGRDILEGYMNTITRAESAVAVVKHMDHAWVRRYNSKQEAAEAMARSVHDSWGVGDATKQDGVLLFFALNDRTAYISTGAGVDSILTTSMLESVCS